jgi:phosphopentomutase
MINRIILIVLDSVGIGAMPDAYKYGDEGTNTLYHVYQQNPNFRLKNLEEMGLLHIDGLEHMATSCMKPLGAYARLEELSPGKDTTTGHWEMAGHVLSQPFPTYPHGFPDEVLLEFTEKTGYGYLGNKAASGTAIIEELGEEHMRTGKVILYTSADSVFQIAAHENIVPLEKLYELCNEARKILTGEHAVGRVIARPFTGEPGQFIRTPNRKDFSLEPSSKTMMDYIKDAHMDVVAIGKIEDIFNGKGITKAIHTQGNVSGIDITLEEIKNNSKGLIFTNLVDFDMLYGHRNNPEGYGNSLKEFDDRLPEIIAELKDDDILMITADHGCDPTTISTDHSREYVPWIVYGSQITSNNLGTIKGFNVIAKTILDYLNITNTLENMSIKPLITRG